MDQQFTGKTAIVTGAASGIGKAVALALANEGANVVVAELKLDSARAVADVISSRGGSALAVAGTVGKPDDVKRRRHREQLIRARSGR